MTQTGMYHGGIVFHDDAENPLDGFCRIVTATLEDYGHQVERQSVIDAGQARVVTSQYLVKLSLDERRYRDRSDARRAGKRPAKARHRLEIEMTPAAEGYEDRDISELMLVVMLYRMVDICNTELIEWMDPGTVLTVDQFLSAFTNVSPHRVHGSGGPRGPGFASSAETAPDAAGHHDELAEDASRMVELTEDEALALAFRAPGGFDAGEGLSPGQEAQSDIRRLAIWGMTGMIAVLSTPVAASMAAVNLVRGEDFRLNTQVLSLTGLLVVLNSSGALASAVSYLPI